MNDLNERVIDAAAASAWMHVRKIPFFPANKELHEVAGSFAAKFTRRVAKDVITAADAARAPEIIAAVEDIADAACDRCSESGGYQSDKDRVFADARRELLALFGIEATP
mgnify:CR=1 FL=1